MCGSGPHADLATKWGRTSGAGDFRNSKQTNTIVEHKLVLKTLSVSGGQENAHRPLGEQCLLWAGGGVNALFLLGTGCYIVVHPLLETAFWQLVVSWSPVALEPAGTGVSPSTALAKAISHVAGRLAWSYKTK